MRGHIHRKGNRYYVEQIGRFWFEQREPGHWEFKAHDPASEALKIFAAELRRLREETTHPKVRV